MPFWLSPDKLSRETFSLMGHRLVNEKNEITFVDSL